MAGVPARANKIKNKGRTLACQSSGCRKWRRQESFRGLPGEAYFRVFKIAPRVFGPGVAGDLIRPHPGIAVADFYMGTGGTALNIQEAGSATSRRAQLKDVRDMARMVESLNNIHFYMLNVYPSDLPVEEIDVNRFGAALNSTNKHIMGGVYTVEGVRNIIRMAERIAGSPESDYSTIPP